MLSRQLQPESECRVTLRPLQIADANEFIELMRNSQSFHRPWIHPPVNEAQFRLYLERFRQPQHKNYAICEKTTGAIAGVINLNYIAMDCPLSASLGYYVGAYFAGMGYMFHGMQLVIKDAFNTLQLHRLEANIQPGNQASIKLVKNLGFQYEGQVREFLFIEGAWRDHERWALIDHRSGLWK